MLQRFDELVASGADQDITNLLLAYYLARPTAPEAIGLAVNIATLLSVTASLGEFDFSSHLTLFARCAALSTDRDISTPDLLDDLLSAVAGRYTLAGVGHFPGHEAPEAFEAILSQVFRAESIGAGHSAA